MVEVLTEVFRAWYPFVFLLVLMRFSSVTPKASYFGLLLIFLHAYRCGLSIHMVVRDRVFFFYIKYTLFICAIFSWCSIADQTDFI